MAGRLRALRCGWGVGVENHSFVVTDHKFIAPLRCSECGGNAHLIRRSPHAVKSLEIRIFECHECRCQTQRIVTGEGRVP
jgi:Zn finger protein HypA/HybF involved in hydrogenase expression